MKADGSLLLFQPFLNCHFYSSIVYHQKFQITKFTNYVGESACLGKRLTQKTYNEINLLDFKGIELYFDINLLSVHKKVHMNAIFETTWKRRETLHMKCGYRL